MCIISAMDRLDTVIMKLERDRACELLVGACAAQQLSSLIGITQWNDDCLPKARAVKFFSERMMLFKTKINNVCSTLKFLNSRYTTLVVLIITLTCFH